MGVYCATLDGWRFMARKTANSYGVYIRQENGTLTLAFRTARYISRADCLANGYAKCILINDGTGIRDSATSVANYERQYQKLLQKRRAVRD